MRTKTFLEHIVSNSCHSKLLSGIFILKFLTGCTSYTAFQSCSESRTFGVHERFREVTYSRTCCSMSPTSSSRPQSRLLLLVTVSPVRCHCRSDWGSLIFDVHGTQHWFCFRVCGVTPLTFWSWYSEAKHQMSFASSSRRTVLPDFGAVPMVTGAGLVQEATATGSPRGFVPVRTEQWNVKDTAALGNPAGDPFGSVWEVQRRSGQN